MPPILPFVVESFVKYLNDFDKVLSAHHCISLSSPKSAVCSLIVGQLRDLMHLPARRRPWVVGRCIADLGLGVRVALGVVLGHTENTLSVVRECRHERVVCDVER